MSTLPNTSGLKSSACAHAPGVDQEDGGAAREFISEAIEHVDSVEAAALRLDLNPDDSSSINTIFRGFHTIKGALGFLSLPQIGRLCARGRRDA